MQRVFDDAFARLLVAWRSHHDLRARRAPVRELADSRRRLDEARDRIRRVRMALVPEETELEASVLTVSCPDHHEPIFLYRRDVTTDRHGRVSYRCLCGRRATAPIGHRQPAAGSR